MINSFKVQKTIVFLILISFLTVSETLGNVQAISYGDVIEISTLVQNPNGIGVVFDNDISSFLQSDTYFYILVALTQSENINGLYIAGFDSNGNSTIVYKLGDPSDGTSLWFDFNTSLMLNYGSIVYLDILDYIIAFGMPSDIKALALVSPIHFKDISLNANTIVNDYQNSFVDVTNTTSSSTTITNSNSSDFLSSLNGFYGILVIGALLAPVVLRKTKK